MLDFFEWNPHGCGDVGWYALVRKYPIRRIIHYAHGSLQTIFTSRSKEMPLAFKLELECDELGCRWTVTTT